MSQPSNLILPQKLILLLVILLSFSELRAQVLTVNDGFEGTPAFGIPPPGWVNCPDGKSTVDTQPGITSNYGQPAEGKTYVSLVAREHFQPGTVETVFSELLIPFEKGGCYNFKLDLSLSKEFHFFDFGDLYSFEYPCGLQIIGCNDNCASSSDRVVLWQSDSLEKYGWVTYDVTIYANKRFSKIGFRPYFLNSSIKRNSVVFIDNIQYPETPNVLFIQDDFLKLPAYASSISWYFNDVLVPNENSHSMPLLGNGRYKATYYDDNNCYRITAADFYQNIEAIDVYPNPTIDQSYVEFFSYKEGKYTFKLYDEIGKLIRTEFFDMIYGKNTALVDLSEFAAGSYVLKIERDNLETQLFRLIRTH